MRSQRWKYPHFSVEKNEATTVCSFPSELSPLRALIMAVVIVFKWDCTLVARLQSCKPIQNCFSPLLLVVSCCSSERLAMINYLNMLEKTFTFHDRVSPWRPAKDKLKIRLYNSSKKFSVLNHLSLVLNLLTPRIMTKLRS